MQAIATTADLYAHYSQAEFPTSLSHPKEHAISDDERLPEKSANQKEVDRHAYYFNFADKALAKLDSRGLWVKNNESRVYEAKPDAGERLKTAFSTFLTSFVSLGESKDVAKPVDLVSGFLCFCPPGIGTITGSIFVFNTIVSLLKKAFPSQKAYLDQAGKLSYFSASAAHSAVSAILPIVSEVRSSHVDPVFSIVMISIELLLGFYSTVTATEANLARQEKKSEILTDLINAKYEAERFFKKARDGVQASASEAAAYEKFMTAIGKLDKFSERSKFSGRILATSTTKEWLWFGGAVIGNETAYKNLASTQIAVSGPELLGTALSEMAMSLVANIADLIHGLVVPCKNERGIRYGTGLVKKLQQLPEEIRLSVMAPIVKGLTRIIGNKIEDEKYEQGFARFRTFKALVLVSIGIVGIVALATSAVLAAPWIMGMTAGIALAAFFIFLIARSVRAADSARELEKEETKFEEEHKNWSSEYFDEIRIPEEAQINAFLLFHALSVCLVDMEKLPQKGSELELFFTALNFQEIEIALLKTIANTFEADREKKIELVTKQLTRMMELKLASA
jgi:hypothetical protein